MSWRGRCDKNYYSWSIKETAEDQFDDDECAYTTGNHIYIKDINNLIRVNSFNLSQIEYVKAQNVLRIICSVLTANLLTHWRNYLSNSFKLTK